LDGPPSDTLAARGYGIQAIYTDRSRKALLTPGDMDVLVACRRARCEHYREAWHRLQGEAGRHEEKDKKEPGRRTTARRT
jgi:hypothetical protein